MFSFLSSWAPTSRRLQPFTIALSALISTSVLASCGAPRHLPAALPSQQMAQNVRSLNAPVQAQGTTLNPQQLQAWLPLFKEIYGAEFADALQKGEIPPELQDKLKVYGPQAFQLLSQDANARAQLYPASDALVIREFTKPSVSDQIPPLSAHENQELLRQLKPGDIILCGNDGSFIHGALYIGNGKIVHALATQPDMKDRFRGVVEESWLTYTQRSERDTVVVLRPNLNSSDQQQVINYARSQRNKGYDSLFINSSDERFYCTELVWKALQQARRAPRVFAHEAAYGWSVVSVEDFMDSPDLQTVYQRNFSRPQPGQRHRY